MEVTAELYAWLSELKILNKNKTFNLRKDKKILLDEVTSSKFLNGFYLDKILFELEGLYNNFYNIKLTYSVKLNELRILQENSINNETDFNLRISIWRIIQDITENFGIEITNKSAEKIASGDYKTLSQVLNAVFSLSMELMKKAPEKKESKNINKSFVSDNESLSQNFSSKKSLRNENTTIVSSSSKNNTLQKTTGVVDINNIDTDKDLNFTSSPLEFFIVSLSKALNLKPRQAVALLSNNRKFLIQIANRGIKGDFSKVVLWYQELFFNYQTLINLVNISSTKDAKSMTFATLTVGMFSKNTEVAHNAFQILCQLDNDMGMDYEWLFKDGLEILYFTISKQIELKQDILSLLEKIHKEIPDKLSLELFNVRKLGTHKIYEFLGNVMENLMDCNENFLEIFRRKIPEFCFNEKNDLCLSISILGDYWIKILKGKSTKKKNQKKSDLEKQREDIIINNILKFYKNAAREKNNKNLLVVVISQFFRLVKKLGELKDEYAPQIYKVLVFMFLENYNDTKIREIFLFNFLFIFEIDNKMPIDILLDPYLRQLKGTNNKSNLDVMNVTNYDISDFKFLLQIISHQKISLKILKEIIEFCTLVSYTNIFLSRTANLLINTILEKNLGQYNDLLNSKNLNQEVMDIYDVCISYIKNTLRIFVQNPKDLMILETPYDIVNLNIDYIISAIENDVVDAVEVYRKKQGNFSQGLLALLWIYEKHDDVLLNLEEKYTERFDKHVYKNNLISSEIKEKRNLDFIISGKPEKFLKLLKDKRDKKQRNLENKEFQIIQNNKYALESMPSFIKKKVIEETDKEKISELLKSMNIKYNNLNDDGVNKIKNLIKSSINPNRLLKLPITSSSIMIGEGDKSPLAISEVLLRNLPTFYDYETEGELREKEAIEGLTKQYSRNIKRFFAFYVTESNNTIVKNNLLKMFRELGVDNESLSMDEFNSLIKTTFGSLPKNVNKSQFEILLTQIGYAIYPKFKPQFTISMSYQELLKIISYWCRTNKLNSNKESVLKKPKRDSNKTNNKSIAKISQENSNQNIFEYLKSKVEYVSAKQTNEEIESLISLEKKDADKNKAKEKEDKENIPENKKNFLMIPPGYTKKLMTEVQFEYSLPRNLVKDLISESTIICYEIISGILKKEFSSPIVEPHVKIFEEMKLLDESAEPKKNWGNALTIAYTKLDKKYEKVATETTDLLEEVLRAVSYGRENIDKPKYQTNIEKSFEEEKLRKLKEKEESDRLRNLRKKELNKRLTELKNEKKFEEQAKEEQKKKEELQKGERMKSLTKAVEQKRLQMKQDIEKKKKEKEKMKEDKENNEKAKKEEKLKILEEEKKKFYKKQKRKLKEQFKEIKEERKDNYLKQQQELITPKLPETNIQQIIEKDRDYVEFEKKLNEKIEELLIRNDIKEFLKPYEEHFRLIYDIYSNLGSKKFTFFAEKAIHANEFKEFCSNFMIFGLLLTSDQINYIFKKISLRNLGSSDDLFFLRYNDFMVSIIYISICLKNSRRKDDRITQSDLNKVNVSSLRNLIEYMGLKIPYNKKELENFINDRRMMSAKQSHLFMSQTKKKTVKSVKNPENSAFQKNAINDILAKEKEEDERLNELEEMRKREIEENERKIALQKERDEKKKLEESNKNTNTNPNSNTDANADANANKGKDEKKGGNKKGNEKRNEKGNEKGNESPKLDKKKTDKPNADKNPNFAGKKSNNSGAVGATGAGTGAKAKK